MFQIREHFLFYVDFTRILHDFDSGKDTGVVIMGVKYGVCTLL